MVHHINGRRQPCTSLRERVQRAITFRGLGLRAISFFRASKTRKEKSSLNTRQNNAAILCNAKYEDSKEI